MKENLRLIVDGIVILGTICTSMLAVYSYSSDWFTRKIEKIVLERVQVVVERKTDGWTQPNRGEVDDDIWKRAETVKSKIQGSDDFDFCFLTAVAGRFEGVVEYVRVVRRNDGWYLEGSSAQQDVGFSVSCANLTLSARAEE